MSFLLPALLAFYLGVLLGYHPMIALGGATLMTIARDPVGRAAGR
jgi:hypothetical protein